MIKYTAKYVNRFWSNIAITANDNLCWEWQRSTDKDGYGQFYFGNETGWHRGLSHRGAWEMLIGEIPAGLKVLHKCDNPKCCNPKHLFIGTSQDNTLDMFAKGRGYIPAPKGERNSHCKLTESQVLEIRKQFTIGESSFKELAHTMNVSPATISSIVKRRTWKHI